MLNLDFIIWILIISIIIIWTFILIKKLNRINKIHNALNLLLFVNINVLLFELFFSKIWLFSNNTLIFIISNLFSSDYYNSFFFIFNIILFTYVLILNIKFIKNKKDKTEENLKRYTYNWILLTFSMIICFTISLTNYNNVFLNKTDNIKITNKSSTFKMYYQNIYLPKNNKEIESIYKSIEKENPHLVSVVENSYEFNDYLLNKWYTLLSWNRKTECAVYWNNQYYNWKEIKFEDYIIETQSGYKICNLKIKWNNKKIEDLNLFVVHPHPPRNEEYKNKQQLFFKELKWLISLEENKNAIVVWDFNATLSNPVFRNTFKDYFNDNLFVKNTWFTKKWYLGKLTTLTIDHILINKDNNKNNFSAIGLDFNFSDHRPLLLFIK